MDEWLEIARREAGITSGSRICPSTLICTSYNPVKHAIKGILQPHGVETGWIPVAVIGAGPKFGVVIGPKAGDPQKLDGDQFSIEFENGDPNTPIARHRLSSDQDTPPQVQTGEVAIVSQFNHHILLKKDGSISVITNDKDVAQQNQNTNPVLGHSASSVQNNKTINHQTILDPVKQTLTHFSTNGTITHSTIYDLIKNTLTHTSTQGATPGTPAAQSLPVLPNLPGLPGMTGGTQTFQHIFDLLGGKLTHQATNQTTTHSTIMDLIKGVMTHSSTSGGTSHGISLDAIKGIMSHITSGGGGSHSIVMDLVKGISTSTSAAHSRTASQTITDTASSLIHNGPTSVSGTLGVSQLASFAGGLGTGAFEVAPDAAGGLCQATKGLQVTQGLTTDSLDVESWISLPPYTIAGLALIPSPFIGMQVYVSDTLSNAPPAFNAIPTGGGSITVNRPVTWDGAAWRY